MWTAWEAAAKAAEAAAEAAKAGTSTTEKEMLGAGLAATAVQPQVAWLGGFERVVVPDNSAFVEIFDQDLLAEKIEGPMEFVAVKQDPAAGDYVPAGSRVTVTFFLKDLFPLDTFKGISEEVVEKFDSVGELVEQIKGSAAQEVIGKDVEYAHLSPGEKVTVDQFIATKVGVEDADEEMKSRLFSDIKVLYGL
jgi:hypothetical protein